MIKLETHELKGKIQISESPMRSQVLMGHINLLENTKHWLLVNVCITNSPIDFSSCLGMFWVQKIFSLFGNLWPKIWTRAFFEREKTYLKDWHGGVESRAGRMIGAFTVCCWGHLHNNLVNKQTNNQHQHIKSGDNIVINWPGQLFMELNLCYKRSQMWNFWWEWSRDYDTDRKLGLQIRGVTVSCLWWKGEVATVISWRRWWKLPATKVKVRWKWKVRWK